MTDGITVLGICGSLRKGSYNRMVLEAARKLTPAGMTIKVFEGLRDIPPYDEDVKEAGYPPSTQALREAIRGADALLIVSPEYNYSLPGVLKNAIDWASRPPEQPFKGKPMAIMGASPGASGTARMQIALRQCFVYLDARILNQPEITIGQCTQKFSAGGVLSDEATAGFITAQLKALSEWTQQLRR